MIHWDWILTGFVGYVLYAILTVASHLFFPIARVIIRDAIQQYFPAAMPVFDEVLYSDPHAQGGVTLPDIEVDDSQTTLFESRNKIA